MTKMLSPPALAVSVMALVGLAACTGDDDGPPSTTTTAPTTVPVVTAPSADLTQSYFEALSSGTGDAAVVDVAVPGSAAAIYCQHQAMVRDLLGLPAERALSAGVRSFELCDPDRVCTGYGAVVSDPVSGQVTSFSIEGVPLAGRIVGGGLVADRDGIIGRVGSAYRSNDLDVLVLVEVDNTTDVAVEVFAFAAVLESASGGDSVETTGAWGSMLLDPGATSDLLLLFPAAELGGEVRLSGLRDDGLDIELEIRLPNPV
jgi:hypothetical protein